MSAIAQRLDAEGVEVVDGPAPIARPADEEMLAAVLARAAAEGARVVPVGGCGRLAWCRPEAAAGQVDLLVSTARFDRVLDHVPGDGTLTAQAGCTMAALERTVAAGGHVLTPAVGAPERASLGGSLAAGHSGVDRERCGPARHHVLGLRVMLADGTRARSGGKLVKNVTGFDLHRLYTGSRGTLCVLLEASLRLFPAPQARAGFVLEADDPAPLLARAADLRRAPFRPWALVVEGGGDAWRLHVSLAGMEPQVEVERGWLAGARPVDDPAAHLDHLRDLERAEGWPHLALGCRPSDLAACVAHLRAAGARRLVVQPGVAEVLAWCPTLAQAGREALAPRLATLETDLRAQGARLAARDLPAAHALLAPRPGQAPALRWMNDLRRALDPDGRFASPTFPGRP